MGAPSKEFPQCASGTKRSIMVQVFVDAATGLLQGQQSMATDMGSNVGCTPFSDGGHIHGYPGRRSTCVHHNAVGRSGDPHQVRHNSRTPFGIGSIPPNGCYIVSGGWKHTRVKQGLTSIGWWQYAQNWHNHLTENLTSHLQTGWRIQMTALTNTLGIKCSLQAAMLLGPNYLPDASKHLVELCK